MHKNSDEAFDSMYEIEHTLLRRKPTIERWAGYHMANTEKWYYAYKIDGDNVEFHIEEVKQKTLADYFKEMEEVNNRFNRFWNSIWD
jgi:hypothetical protein